MSVYKVVTLVICDTHTPYWKSLRAEAFFLFISRMAWSRSSIITLTVLQKVKRRWSLNVPSDLYSSKDNKVSLSYTVPLNFPQCYVLDTSVWIPHVLVRSWGKQDLLGRVRHTRRYALTQADTLWHCKNKVKFLKEQQEHLREKSEQWTSLSGTFQPLGTANCAAHCWRMGQGKSRPLSSMHRAGVCQDRKMRTKCSNPNGVASTFPFHWFTNKNTRKKIYFDIYSQQHCNLFSSKGCLKCLRILRKLSKLTSVRTYNDTLAGCKCAELELSSCRLLMSCLVFSLSNSKSLHQSTCYLISPSTFPEPVLSSYPLCRHCSMAASPGRKVPDREQVVGWKAQIAFKL